MRSILPVYRFWDFECRLERSGELRHQTAPNPGENGHDDRTDYPRAAPMASRTPTTRWSLAVPFNALMRGGPWISR